jgi:class 3 adenylate cyclase
MVRRNIEGHLVVADEPASSPAAISPSDGAARLGESAPLTGAQRYRTAILVVLVLLLLAGLPVAVWLDLRQVSESLLNRQAADVNAIISGFRGYYAGHVVGRILASPGHTQVIPNYDDVPGAIPIPATLSLELGRVVSTQQHNIAYRFVSDFPFKNRPAHALDAFERGALASLRQDPTQRPIDVSWSLFTDRVRLVVPVLMEPACVACHNANSDSTKHDWKAGDIRGIQEVTISQPLVTNLFAFRYLLLYFLFMAAVGLSFILLQNRQASTIERMNRQLTAANDFLTAVSNKISHYLSPQIFRSIFSGEMDAVIRTERKKLTIFFSDIKDFTAITEQLQPEEMTARLNEYFTEMSAIALAHGGTIDKFIGDAILIFFGDPESKGAAEDARACLKMAVEMQRRVGELNAKWRRRGIETPFLLRMGINTGYCNVGNFGSKERMEYTIIGAEANLAARLEAIAEPGEIVLSCETYALVRPIAEARPLPPVPIKGIARAVTPYVLDELLDPARDQPSVLEKHLRGADLYIDPTMIDPAAAPQIRNVLAEAMTALDRRTAGSEDPRPQPASG